jgi:hypothetical protein
VVLRSQHDRLEVASEQPLEIDYAGERRVVDGGRAVFTR